VGCELVVRLNVGTGPNVDPSPDVVNVDWHAFPGVNVLHDIDQTPWPFDDNQFSDCRAVHVFEHLHNPLGFMAEAHRVLEPGGSLRLYVPHYQSENSFTDPTHVRHCTLRTFDYWCVGTQLFNESAYAGDATFLKESVVKYGDDIHAVLRKVRNGHSHRPEPERH
jgi:SAM-dependent methyltransferase